MQNTGSGNNMIPMSEINVTPLVDVMLVLLIIFMLAAPHLEYGVKVDLPKVSVEPMPTRADELVITVTRDKTIFMDEVKVPEAGLEPVLREAMKTRQQKGVYIRADRNVPYGFVVGIMAAARKAGITGLGMVTEPEEIR